MLPAIPETAPAYLAALLAANPELAALNQEALSGSAKPMPPTIVADKGKFVIKKDGQETVITFPDNDTNRAAGIVGMPVPQLQAVVLKGKAGREKSYYITKFQPGQETTSPDCFSEDGIKPDPSSRHKQCESCASCPQNVFGSGTKQDGSQGDGKACNDRKVLAVFAAGSVYRFAVPPASLSGKRASGLGMAWDPYCNSLSAKGLPIISVITAISFEQGEKDYQLNFNFGGMLVEKQLNAIIPMLQTPEVADIVNPRSGTYQASLPAPPAQGQIEAPAQQSNVVDINAAAAAAEEKKKAAAEKAAATKKANAERAAAEAAEKAAAASAGAGLDLGLGGLNEAPAVQAAVVQPVAQSTSAGDDAMIDALGL